MADEGPGNGAGFPTTNWTLVRHAGAGDSARREDAQGQLLAHYRPALLAHLVFARRIDPHEAEDLLQDFVLNKILLGDLFARAASGKGKLRTLLLTALDRFVIDAWRAANARKRKPDQLHRLDDDAGVCDRLAAPAPAAFYEVAWGLGVLGQALRRCRAECLARHRPGLWTVFQSRLLDPVRGLEPAEYALLAQQHGWESAKQAANDLSTVVRWFRRHLRDVLAEQAGDAEVEAEIAELGRILERADPECLERLRGHLWSELPDLSAATVPGAAFDPASLTRVLHLASIPASDPGAAFRHIWSGRLLLDWLPGTDRGGNLGGQWRSLAELFGHPAPPLELLQLLKGYAKVERNATEGTLPPEVATVLYYAAIAAALARHGTRITQHDAPTLEGGFRWAGERPWVPKGLKEIFRQAAGTAAGA